MLTLHNLSSAGQAETYYSDVNDYYTAEVQEQEQSEQDPGEHILSEFHGCGAALLGLEGTFDRVRFTELLAGKIDVDTQVGRRAAGELEHRSGWDATLSAPKSVSIMALVAGDTRIVDAHHKAVKQTIHFLENQATFMRNGEGKLVKTDNLTVASFTHMASRNLDPQLHTHNVIMNITRSREGNWRSLEPRPIYRQQKLAGALYRSSLAHQLQQELGYQIEYSKEGYFELAAVPKSLVKQWSSRRKEIEKAVEHLNLGQGVSGNDKQERRKRAMAREDAALKTRQTKETVSKRQLHALWDQVVSTQDKDLKALIPKPQQREPIEEAAMRAAIHDVHLAIKHLGSFEAVFTVEAMQNFMLDRSLGRYSPEVVTAAIQLSIDNKELLPSLVSRAGYTAYHSFTTPAALKKEQFAVDMMNQGKGSLARPILSNRKVQQHIDALHNQALQNKDQYALNEGQANSLNLILTTKDQFVGIEGYAGTGKTVAVKQARLLAEGAGYSVTGFAPTGAAAEKLAQATGMKAQTIDAFLFRHKRLLEDGKSCSRRQKALWIVDEAGLGNARHIVDMMVLARKLGARMVLQGDPRQLAAVEWGKFFTLLSQCGMATDKLDHIMRQRDPALKTAVYQILDRDYRAAMDSLGSRVREHSEDRVSPLVRDWARLSERERSQAMVVIPDLETKYKTTAQMRQLLQERGVLGADTLTAHSLVDARLSDAQKGDARFYESGRVVQFGITIDALGIRAGDRFTVVSSQGLDTVSLKSDSGEKIIWNPQTNGGKRFVVDVFQCREMSLAKGDSVRWTRTDKQIGLKNGDTGRIVDLDARHNTAKIAWSSAKGNKPLVITHPLNRDRYLDHNYVTTAFGSQGLDARHVLVIAESWRRNLVNEKSFYVKLSRARDSISIYTDDKKKLITALSRSGDKTSALEARAVRNQQIGRQKERSAVSLRTRILQKLQTIGKQPQVVANRSPSKVAELEH
jgi:conjugative relaxase-like TrwC/TraI family protein